MQSTFRISSYAFLCKSTHVWNKGENNLSAHKNSNHCKGSTFLKVILSHHLLRNNNLCTQWSGQKHMTADCYFIKHFALVFIGTRFSTNLPQWRLHRCLEQGMHESWYIQSYSKFIEYLKYMNTYSKEWEITSFSKLLCVLLFPFYSLFSTGITSAY